jgi:hypothetical protein
MDPVRNTYNPGAGTPPPALVGRDALIESFGITAQSAFCTCSRGTLISN